MPWGHAAFGYLLNSLGIRSTRRRSPTGIETYTVIFAAILPDLVDKPLSWVFHIFPEGDSVAHSIFVAVPVGLLVLWLATRRDRASLGAAFALGYWSHLLGDVIMATVELGSFHLGIERLLWPIVQFPPYAHHYPVLSRIGLYLSIYAHKMIGTSPGRIALFCAPFLCVFVLWLADGAPGFPKPSHRPQ